VFFYDDSETEGGGTSCVDAVSNDIKWANLSTRHRSRPPGFALIAYHYYYSAKPRDWWSHHGRKRKRTWYGLQGKT